MTGILKVVEHVKLVYFSGTGGTARVASCLEKTFINHGASVVKTELKAGWKYSSEMEDLLVILYPVHAFNAPEPVYEWIEGTQAVAGIPAVVVSVSGGGEITPNTACRAGCIKRLGKKGYNVVYEKMIVMPSNIFVQTHDGLAVRLLEILPSKVEHIVDEVLKGVVYRARPNLLNKFLSFTGELEKTCTKSFGKSIKVNEDCSSCGWCEGSCPRDNIRLVEGRPVFENRCIACLKCIYGCPQKALKAGKGKALLVKEGYGLEGLEKRMRGVEPGPVEILAKGYLWKGIREYLLKE